MSIESVQEIIGTAITDRQFMRDLLNAKREKVIARFELTPEEHRVISGIQAETIEQFACQLDDWLVRREQMVMPVAPIPAARYRYDLAHAMC